MSGDEQDDKNGSPSRRTSHTSSTRLSGQLSVKGGFQLALFCILLVLLARGLSFSQLAFSDTELLRLSSQHKLQEILSSPTFHKYLNDESNVRIPTHQDGTKMSLEERFRYLEMKVNAGLNFGVRDPFLGETINHSLCRNSSRLDELGCVEGFEGWPECRAGHYDHMTCLDPLPDPVPFSKTIDYTKAKTNDCLIYDFGIRAQPQFGAVMARIFGCEVHAFDPSPVSIDWWESEKAAALRALPNYHFHPYGAGGVDGDLTLNEYNWGQVSIIRYPTYYLDCSKVQSDADNCKLVNVEQKRFRIQVKTLPTIRKDLNHTDRKIDILKLDVEGSEYAFLEQMLDTQGGCPDYINELSLEWHHHSWDPTYGEGSSTAINTISTLLRSCGLRLFWKYISWPAGDSIYPKMGLTDIRYSLASYIKVKDDE